MKTFLALVGISIFCSYEYKDISANTCNLSNVSFSKQVNQVFQLKCSTPTCHGAPRANALPLRTYSEIILDTSDIRFYIITERMPLRSTLSECEKKLIINWLNQGGKNN